VPDYTPKVGDRVRLVRDVPDGLPVDELFTVAVINDPEEHPGKVIGVEAGARWPMLHSCDGAVAEMRGWWTLPEHLEPVQL
jgi:hypothetical protein